MEETLVTGEAVALEVRPASLALRVAGGTIDLLVYGLGTAAMIWLLIVALGGGDEATSRIAAVLALVLGLVVAPMLVETLSGGRSLGRLAVGARIVRDDGGAITARHAFIRALMGVVEVCMTLGGVALLAALVSARTKRLGDMLAGTYSRHERFPAPRPLALSIPPELLAWAATADVARLPDPLARRIAGFLRQAPRLHPAARARIAAELLDETSGRVHPLPQAPAEAVLIAVAMLRRDREAAALQRQAAVIERLEPVLGSRHGLPDRG